MKQKILALMLTLMALATTTPVRADWSHADAYNRITVTSKMSATQQYVTIRYPEINYLGSDDGIYNVKISTPDGLVFQKDKPKNNTMTTDGHGYHCITSAEDVEENSSSYGNDTRYRSVSICMKQTTTEKEYKNFRVTISFDVYIDKTSDNASPNTQFNVSKTFYYSDLVNGDLQYPTLRDIAFTYNMNNSLTINCQSPALTNGWNTVIKYTDSSNNKEEENILYGESCVFQFSNVKEYGTMRETTLTPYAYKVFELGGYSFGRKFVPNNSITLSLGRRHLGNFKLEKASGGMQLSWGINTGNPGGKVIIRRKAYGETSYTQINVVSDDKYIYLDTQVNPDEFLGWYSITYQGAYESEPDEKATCVADYTGSNVAYCVLSGDVVTYYCRKSALGTTVKLKRINERKHDWGTIAKKAVIDPSFDAYRGKNLSYMFAGLTSITSIDGMQYLHTDDATNMNNMFSNCLELTSLDISKFNTTNVTDMSCMFMNCSSLTSLDISKFNTTNVTDMDFMFYSCSNLTALDVSKFNTTNVANMKFMFDGCNMLKTIYASDKFVTNKVKYSKDMFKDCSNLVGKVSYNSEKAEHNMANFDGYFTKAIKGDVNNDRRVSIADIAETVKILHNKGNNNGIYAPVDMNEDGKIDMLDMQQIVEKVKK